MTAAIVLDTGALIALDRNDRAMWANLRIAATDSTPIYVPAATIAQAWRDGARQALLVRALRECTEVPLDGDAARSAGILCGRAATSDIVDASVVVAAMSVARHESVVVLTSDPDDVHHLAGAAATNLRIEQG